MDKETLINRLKNRIDARAGDVKNGWCPKDKGSWIDQWGILLTVDEAEAIVNHLKSDTNVP